MEKFAGVIVIIMFLLIAIIPIIQVAAIGVQEFPVLAYVIPIGIVVLIVIGLYNHLVRLKQNVIRERHGIDVYLKQRFDLIPNLVETVKGYRDYEKDILVEISNIRTQYLEDKDNTSKNNELNLKLDQMLALVESYPELKASESFLNLQKTLSKLETQLQAARRLYNIAVTEYNVAIQKFPNVIIARIFNFSEEELFEIDATERENAKIQI